MTTTLSNHAARLHRTFVCLAETAFSERKLESFYFYHHVASSIYTYILDNSVHSAASAVPGQQTNKQNQKNAES